MRYKRHLLTLAGKRNAEFKLLQSVLFYAHHKWLFLFIVPASNVNRIIRKLSAGRRLYINSNVYLISGFLSSGFCNF